MINWMRISAVGKEGGVYKVLPSYEITGINNHFYLVEASGILDAANRTIQYVHNESGAKADIFLSLDRIPSDQRAKYYYSTDLGVAIKYPRDEIKISLSKTS
jgi:hypothetical protein